MTPLIGGIASPIDPVLTDGQFESTNVKLENPAPQNVPPPPFTASSCIVAVGLLNGAGRPLPCTLLKVAVIVLLGQV